MILRVEDTDAERNKPELVQGIIDGLQWLGLDWDGGPFYQSQRLALYKDAAQKCLANGSAFPATAPLKNMPAEITPPTAPPPKKFAASSAVPAATANPQLPA